MTDNDVTGGNGPRSTKKAGGGILREPKYSGQAVPSSASATAGGGAAGGGMSSTTSSAYPVAEDDDAGGQFIEDQVPVIRPLIRDLVVERDPTKLARQRQMQKQTVAFAASGAAAAASPAVPSPGVAASAIEGYAPATGSGGSGGYSNASAGSAGATIISIPPDPSAAASATGIPSEMMMAAAQPSAPTATSSSSSSSSISNKPKSGGPTVIKSISQLVALAQGTSEEAAEGIDVADIRRRQESGEEVALETDMAFSCMTEEEYKETLDMAKKMQIGDIDSKKPEKDDNNQEVDDDDDDDNEEDGDTDFEEGCMLNKVSDEPTLEEVFFGQQQPIFGDDTDDVDDSENESRMSEYEGDGGTHGGGGGGSGFMDFFGADEDDSVGEPEPAPKSFISLWNAMSSWITPETTAQIQEWQAEQEAAGGDASAVFPSSTLRQPYDLSDIGASRCGGLMSMVKMHLPRALEELRYNKSDGHVRRLAQSRLANFVRTFNFTDPSPKFDSSLWRALTVVLVDICFPSSVLYPDVALKSQEGSEGQIPPVPISISQCRISESEYKYLVNSAMKSLASGGGGGT
mmetsp:Transcript_26913/g.77610  ORF Transcript_26913/g.77610 Transcript_26913/m.77610 type:complete len:574 (+) Transcript_26913:73-1794(+)